MALSPGTILVTADTPSLPIIIDGLVQVHCACILNDNTMATFMPPLNYAQIYKWWEARVAEVTSGDRQIIVHLSKVSSRTSKPNTEVQIKLPFVAEGKPWPIIPATATMTTPEDLEVAGLVSLATPFSQTGPFRALVEKLFTSPFHRKKGVARAVMKKLEDVAWDLGRWNLLLDTTVGTDAEHVYPRLGYKQVSYIREYGFSPRDGSLLDEIWFFKDLRHDQRL